MQVWRIFATDDGKSSMAPVDVATEGGASAAARSKMLAGKGVFFQHFPADFKAEWHNAPRRQILATISGEGELETSDGQVLVLKPGVVTMVEDTTGGGHSTRPHPSTDRWAVVIPLDDDSKLP